MHSIASLDTLVLSAAVGRRPGGAGVQVACPPPARPTPLPRATPPRLIATTPLVLMYGHSTMQNLSCYLDIPLVGSQLWKL